MESDNEYRAILVGGPKDGEELTVTQREFDVKLVGHVYVTYQQTYQLQNGSFIYCPRGWGIDRIITHLLEQRHSEAT